jgi:hypothetical protein
VEIPISESLTVRKVETMTSRSKTPKSGKAADSPTKHLSESDAKLISNDMGHFSMVR